MTRTRQVLMLIGSIFMLTAVSFDQQPTQTIEIHAHRFAFEPSEISLKKGETVELKLISEDVTHSLVVSDLGINETASKSHPGDATVTPQKTGDFHGRCGRFCGSGHGHMQFTVHVTGS